MKAKVTKNFNSSVRCINFTEMSPILKMLLSEIGGVTFLEWKFNESGLSEFTSELYNNWCERFQKVILKENPSYDDKVLSSMLENKYPGSGYKVYNGRRYEEYPTLCATADKDSFTWFYTDAIEDANLPSRVLAREYARYVADVFDSCISAVVCASVATWEKVFDKALYYIRSCEVVYNEDYVKLKSTGGKMGLFTLTTKDGYTLSKFETRLYATLLDLVTFLSEVFDFYMMKDIYAVDTFNLISRLRTKSAYTLTEGESFESCHTVSVITPSQVRTGDTFDCLSWGKQVGYVYSIDYIASMMYLLDAVGLDDINFRIQYNFNSDVSKQFYCPKGDNEMVANKWKEDLNVPYYFPLAMSVAVIESGLSEKRLQERVEPQYVEAGVEEYCFNTFVKRYLEVK